MSGGRRFNARPEPADVEGLRLRVAVLEELLEEARQALAGAVGGDGGRGHPGLDAVMEGFRREARAGREAVAVAQATAGTLPRASYTWKERILQVVQAHGSPMTCKEIVAGYDRAFPDSWASNLPNTVSVVVSKLARSGALARVPRPGVAGAAYAVPGQHNTYINPIIP